MYQALYRKYRPRTFSDVCGQDHITSVLKTELQRGRVSHAYLFCGSRGTGKTTCAKILAKAVNCLNPKDGEPCNECDACLAIQEETLPDVVEMDAASNNGVDDIRRLCEEVQYLPAQAKKRVYIIDEVHMLSSSAFNALLKTIEEPPEHVLFILATTEVNDIPATVLSRCQRFDFKHITPEVIADRLLYIAQNENISLNRDAALLLARLSDGALRDALSLLEACQGQSGEITVDFVHALLGLGDRGKVLDLFSAVTGQDPDRALSCLNEIYQGSSDLKEVLHQLILLYRDLMVIQTLSDSSPYIDRYGEELSTLKEIASSVQAETILYQTSQIQNFYLTFDHIAENRRASLEVLLMKLCRESLSAAPEAILSRIAKLENNHPVPAPAKKSTVGKEKKSTPDQKPAPQVLASSEKDMTDAPKTYDLSPKLKSVLQGEPFLKPWVSMMRFEKNGSNLKVYTGSFAKGVLSSAGAAKIIQSLASGIDSEILSVEILESSSDASNPQNDSLEGL